MSDSEKEKALKTVAKGAGFLFTATLVGRVLGYLTRLTIARFLDPSGYGLVYLSISIISLIGTLSLFGLPKAIQRYLSYYRGKEDERRVKGTITSSIKISLPASITSAIIIFIFAPWISTHIFHDQSLIPVLRIFSISIPFSNLIGIFSSSIKGFKIAKYEAYIDKIFKSSITLAFIFLFLYFGFGPTGAVGGYLIGFVATCVLFFYYLEDIFPIIKSKIKSIPMKKTLLLFSLPITASSILQAFWGRIDTIMVGMFLTTKEVGIYQSAYPTSMLMKVVPAALSTLFLPVISDLLAKEKMKRIRGLYKTVSKWSFYFTLPLFALTFMFSTAILHFFFGSEYMAGGATLAILSVGVLVSGLGLISMSILNLLEKTQLHIVNSAIALVSAVTLNYLLIPMYGIVGAALATSFTLIIYAFLMILEVRHYLEIWPFSLPFFKSLVAVIISGGFIIYLTDYLIPKLPLPLLIIPAILFLIAYFLLLLLFGGVENDDLIILRGIERKTGFKSQTLRNLIKKFI